MARHATQREVIQINDLLKQQLDVLKGPEGDEPGVVRYKEGWDDKRVASVVSSTLSASSVSKLRIEMYGHVKVPTSEKVDRAEYEDDRTLLTSMLQDRATAHAALKKEHDEVVARFNRLLLALHMKGQLDTKHLMVVDKDGNALGIATVKKA